MAAYLIGRIKIVDLPKWNQYVEGVRVSLVPFAATVIFRGKLDSQLSGTEDHDHVVVIRFEDRQTLDQWFNSNDYQKLIPLRDSAADVIISSYEEYE